MSHQKILKTEFVTQLLLALGFNPMSHTGSIGFIGIGNMGSRMATNLLNSLKSKRKLYVFDKFPNTDHYRDLIRGGAVPAKSASQVAEKCSTIFSMVPASLHVKELYFGSILPALSCQSLLIDCSTIDPSTAREVQKASEERGHVMIDAPVSGGVKGAEAGTLTFMVGTSLPEEKFNAEIRDVFSPMGRPIFCGGPGVGQSVKICNNLILGTQMLGVAEGYGLAQKLGVDLAKFNEIVNASTGQCWSSSKYNPVPGLMDGVPASRDYQGGFMTELMVKDLGLAVEAARSSGYKLPVTDFAHSQYKRASSSGYGALDFGSIFKWLSEQK
jgi:3-hydroxyisobutyrate dehydrogenase